MLKLKKLNTYKSLIGAVFFEDFKHIPCLSINNIIPQIRATLSSILPTFYEQLSHLYYTFKKW
jgi:hypothetical protein